MSMWVIFVAYSIAKTPNSGRLPNMVTWQTLALRPYWMLILLH